MLDLNCSRCTKVLDAFEPSRLELGYIGSNEVAMRRTHLDCERYFYGGKRMFCMTWPALADRPELVTSLAEAFSQIAADITPSQSREDELKTLHESIAFASTLARDLADTEGDTELGSLLYAVEDQLDEVDPEDQLGKYLPQ